MCEITLSGYAYGGEALGRLDDGRAVFVPYTMPGETVRIKLTEQKRGYARAELHEVLSPSAQRVAPHCKHFGACGGCHYQHIAYPDQCSVKETILGDQLGRIGGLVNPPVQVIVPAPQPTDYRNFIHFHLDPDGKVGYMQPHSNQVLAIQECFLPEPPINRTWPQLDFDAPSELERVGLRLGDEEDIQLILESSQLQPPDLQVEDLPVSVVHLSPAGTLVLAGSSSVTIKVAERSFQVSAASFFQVNTQMAAAMVEFLLDNLPLESSSTLIETYSGVGLFSAFLAPHVNRLIAIESNSDAAEDFIVNLDEFDNVELYEAPVEIALPELQVKPDIVLVDPPRSGLPRQVIDSLLALGAPLLAYVSCDPATLSRDARRLVAGGYFLESITPFDLFPQTYHIESISLWRLGA